jgi:Tfp pilus assembly protein PilF
VVIFVYSALIFSAALVYWQVRNFDFVDYDDNLYVYDNQHVLAGLNLQNIEWAFTTGHASNWHPLTWLSLMLDCSIFGGKPGPMHLVNVAFHIANTLLLFAVFNRMTKRIWPSAFVAALFALHPLHIESVAWITERKDVLSTLFWLLTMLAYIRYVEKPSAGRYIIALSFFTLGLMSKPMLVTLPFVLLLLDYWPLSRFLNSKFSILNLLYEKIPFFILAAVSSIVTYLTQRAYGSVAGFEVRLLGDRIANAFLSYSLYIVKTFWPQNLAAHYPSRAVGSIELWQLVLSALLLAGVSLLVLRFWKTQRYLFVGWFWFIVTLVPVIGIVQVGKAAMADRYAYIPCTGLFIMLAWGLSELFSKWLYRKYALGMFAAIVLIALGIDTYRQAGFWKDGVTLFSHTIEVTRNNSFAYYNLGTAYVDSGRYQDAIESFKQAIKIKPNYFDAIYNLGVAFSKIDRYQDAVEAYKQAIIVTKDAKTYVNLGAAYLSLGLYQDAIDAYQQAVKINPDLMEAHFNLGLVYAGIGHFQDAAESFKQAIRIRPDYVDAHFKLGIVYLTAGDKASALEEYKILKSLGARQADQLYSLINK